MDGWDKGADFLNSVLQEVQQTYMCDRESTQLLSLARCYLQLANEGLKRAKDKDMTAEQVAKRTRKYITARPIDAENEVFGHLASAAIRLATIAEKYPDLKLGKDYRKYVKGQRKKAIQESKGEISGNLSEYIHILLRDNTGHIEDGSRIEAEVRKEVIPEISLSTAYSAVEKLLGQIEAELLNNGIVDKGDN